MTPKRGTLLTRTSEANFVSKVRASAPMTRNLPARGMIFAARRQLCSRAARGGWSVSAASHSGDGRRGGLRATSWGVLCARRLDMKLILSSRRSLTLLDAMMKRVARHQRLTQSQAWALAILGTYREANATLLTRSLGWTRQQSHRTLKELQRMNLTGWLDRDEGPHARHYLTDEGLVRWECLHRGLTAYEESLERSEVDLEGFARTADRMVLLLLNRPQAGWASGLLAATERISPTACCPCARCPCQCHSEPL